MIGGTERAIGVGTERDRVGMSVSVAVVRGRGRDLVGEDAVDMATKKGTEITEMFDNAESTLTRKSITVSKRRKTVLSNISTIATKKIRARTETATGEGHTDAEPMTTTNPTAPTHTRDD